MPKNRAEWMTVFTESVFLNPLNCGGVNRAHNGPQGCFICDEYWRDASLKKKLVISVFRSELSSLSFFELLGILTGIYSLEVDNFGPL